MATDNDDYKALENYEAAILKDAIFRTASRNSVRVPAADVKVAFRGVLIPLASLTFYSAVGNEEEETVNVTEKGKDVLAPKTPEQTKPGPVTAAKKA